MIKSTHLLLLFILGTHCSYSFNSTNVCPFLKKSLTSLIRTLKNINEDGKNILWKFSLRGYTHQILAKTSFSEEINLEIKTLLFEIKELRKYFQENHPEIFSFHSLQQQILDNKASCEEKVFVQNDKIQEMQKNLFEKLKKLEEIRESFLKTNPEFLKTLYYLQELQVLKHQLSISSQFTQNEFELLKKVTEILGSEIKHKFIDYSQNLEDYQILKEILSEFNVLNNEQTLKNEDLTKELLELQEIQKKTEGHLIQLKQDIILILESEINLKLSLIKSEVKFSEFTKILRESKFLKSEIISETKKLEELSFELENLDSQISASQYSINRISQTDLEMAQSKVQRIEKLKSMTLSNFDEQILHQIQAKNVLKNIFQANEKNQEFYEDAFQKADLFSLKLQKLLQLEEELDFIFGSLFAQVQNFKSIFLNIALIYYAIFFLYF